MKTFTVTILAVIIAVLTATLSANDKARELKLQQAIDLIESKGDLAKATPLLEEVAKSPDRALAARGLLHLAQAQERYGKGDALATYQRIVRSFGSPAGTAAVAAVVTEARTKVAAMVQRTAGLMARQVMVDDFGNISPDGRYVTFTDWSTGNLVVQDVTSGLRRVLTSNGKRNEIFADGAVPSPDSKLIAYGSQNGLQPYDLRVISRDGGEPRIVYANTDRADSVTPCGWAPDGKWILAIVDKGRERRVIIVPVNGSPTRLVARLNLSALGFSLSPDGRFVAYNRLVDPTGANRDIYQVSVETGVETPLVQHLAVEDMLGWFPSGDRILFESDRGGSFGMWAMAVVDGRPVGEPVLVRGDTGRVASQNNSVLNSTGFTRDGSFYYHVLNRTEDVDVVTLDPATGTRIGPLARLEGRFTGLKLQATWSPAGDKIAYVQQPSSRPTGPNREQRLAIQTIASGDVDLKTLALQNMQNPAWLPDGRSIIVQGRNLEGAQGLHLVNLETNSLTTIATRESSNDIRRAWASVSSDGRLFFQWSTTTVPTETGVGFRDSLTGTERKLDVKGTETFAVSPDGQWLAVVRQPGSRLSVMRSSGGPDQPLSSEVGGWTIWAGTLTWSANGQHVFVVINAPGRGREIWQVPVDGTKPRFTGISSRGDIRRLSAHPDGRRLAISGSSATPETWVLQNIPPQK